MGKLIGQPPVLTSYAGATDGTRFLIRIRRHRSPSGRLRLEFLRADLVQALQATPRSLHVAEIGILSLGRRPSMLRHVAGGHESSATTEVIRPVREEGAD